MENKYYHSDIDENHNVLFISLLSIIITVLGVKFMKIFSEDYNCNKNIPYNFENSKKNKKKNRSTD